MKLAVILSVISVVMTLGMTALKLNGIIAWSWLAVASPVIAFVVLFAIIAIIIIVFSSVVN